MKIMLQWKPLNRNTSRVSFGPDYLNLKIHFSKLFLTFQKYHRELTCPSPGDFPLYPLDATVLAYSIQPYKPIQYTFMHRPNFFGPPLARASGILPTLSPPSLRYRLYDINFIRKVYLSVEKI